MKFVKLALAVTLLLLLASCDSSQRVLDETTLKAERGDTTAQVFLGKAYFTGHYAESHGVLQDYAQGVNWFRKAAEQGDAYALRMLGIAYYRGAGVTRDYAQAANWYRKAAEQGDPGAQVWLGSAYYRGEKGFNEPQDLVLAYTWSNLATHGYHEEAESLRDQVEVELSPAELAEAQRLSSRWKSGKGIEREPNH